MLVKVTIILIPTSSDELVELAKIVLRNLDHETNTGITADCFEHCFVVVCDGSCVSIDVQSALSDRDWPADDAKMIFELRHGAQTEQSKKELLCLGFLAHASPGTVFRDLRVVPHEFFVCLDRNYTLESHFKYIGKELNISSYVEIIDCYAIDFHNTTRTHDLSEESILDLIRSDPQVHSISPEMAFSLVPIEEGELESPSKHQRISQGCLRTMNKRGMCRIHYRSLQHENIKGLSIESRPEDQPQSLLSAKGDHRYVCKSFTAFEQL
ncbi:hypothetical protein KCU93_g235, partial [Aureobasidium melanogenum]